jgi:DNA-binding transcriptional MerR regulator
VKTYTIAQLAKEFDVSLRTLRFYEEHGFVAPAREGTWTRVYSEEQRADLQGVVWARRAGLTLAQIKQARDTPLGKRTELIAAMLIGRREELAAQLSATREALDMVQVKLLPSGPGDVEISR